MLPERIRLRLRTGTRAELIAWSRSERSNGPASLFTSEFSQQVRRGSGPLPPSCFGLARFLAYRWLTLSTRTFPHHTSSRATPLS